MSAVELVAELQQALRITADPQRAAQSKAYLKSADDFLGVSVPAGQRVVADFLRAHGELPFSTVREIAQALWQSNMHEDKRLAMQLMHAYVAALTADEWAMLSQRIRQSGSWDLVDEISAHLLGTLAERFPEFEAEFDGWVADDDLWVRRASLVSQVVRLRQRTVTPARVRDLCLPMIEDKEYFVRKALGWLLRECAVLDPEGTIAFLRPWRKTISRMILREAVCKLDPARQAVILEGDDAGK
ncbi:MAG TPA: DNA alkylation repair protein [Armatimonadota bacterium]|jgi:3-methyladenine DNA glycosylase AlkD